MGTDYAAWLQDLREDPMNSDAAITDGAPERAYLVVMNSGVHMSIILTFSGGRHQRVDAVASTDALWLSKGKSWMDMVSPTSGGLPKRRRSSSNFGPSRPKP